MVFRSARSKEPAVFRAAVVVASATGPASVADIPAALRQIEQPWYQTKQAETVRVAQIRRRFIGDAQLPAIQAQLNGIDTRTIVSIR